MIGKDDILKIAKLAKLSIDESKIDELTKDMDEIIEFANTINTAVTDAESEDFDEINNIVNAFHQDEILESYDRELILKNREGGLDGYFFVKRRGEK
ncbi:Asp-tRNA(Asn)/Glu-tRNA(Gln) amidotransferase subunit GatC [Sedimentibacter sp.]|uniref:Asp-tRNA(Asn)/Glu-tRNA(Gln) amidotransferase subunit GatC n=1 Tax=Sedimentibacter sp. TaxID=1960295 RepID=UPI000ECE1EC6|nr:Asp-tRNA(Asn)/Glu-tRNA(Gln) amidotransferase subunit GatC [Sedimentibacter sp.]HCX62100.1 Asp-tRNA(Asn)/Glu-tRNA(Gln) amidotransferase subunit GatC [Clostridiales bacterium]